MLENFITDTEADQLRTDCYNLIEDMNPAQHQTVFSTTKQVESKKPVSRCFCDVTLKRIIVCSVSFVDKTPISYCAYSCTETTISSKVPIKSDSFLKKELWMPRVSACIMLLHLTNHGFKCY